jgi:hypothetical protein
MIGGHDTSIVLTCQVLFLTTALLFVARAGQPSAMCTMARSAVFSRCDLFAFGGTRTLKDDASKKRYYVPRNPQEIWRPTLWAFLPSTLSKVRAFISTLVRAHNAFRATIGLIARLRSRPKRPVRISPPTRRGSRFGV